VLLSRFFLKSIGLFLLVLPVVATISFPSLMQVSDYLMNFYVAGKLVVAGRAAALYPSGTDSSFLTTEFNRFAHEVLPDLPQRNVSIFMYSPLVAAIFAPYSLLAPTVSMLVWQATSIAAFFACAALTARSTQQSFFSTFVHGLFYVPVFHTVLIGHLGVTLGLLPLCAGYFALSRNRDLLAGVLWSLLLLKPQFLPVAMLVSGALLLNRRYRCAVGLVCGLVLLAGAALLCLGVPVFFQWLAALKLSDTLFSDPRYGYPTYLVTSLPAVLLQAFPMELRDAVKIPAYLLAAVLGGHALWMSWRLLRENRSGSWNLKVVFLIGISVLPLVVPHLLFYDMSVFAVFGMIVYCGALSDQQFSWLRTNHRFYLLALNAYALLWLFGLTKLAQPAVLVLITTWLYVRLMQAAGRMIADKTSG
jgi:hypothetical protein